jgi:hypothetical protein
MRSAERCRVAGVTWSPAEPLDDVTAIRLLARKLRADLYWRKRRGPE